MSKDLQRPWIFGPVAQVILIAWGIGLVWRGIELQRTGHSGLWAFVGGSLFVLMAGYQRFLMPLMVRTRRGGSSPSRTLHLEVAQSRVTDWIREILDGLEQVPTSAGQDPASITVVIWSRYLGLSKLRSEATVTLTPDASGTIVEISSHFMPPALADAWCNKKNVDEIEEALRERVASGRAVPRPEN